MHATPRVVLLVETSKAVGRGMLAGIRQYIREHESWSIWAEERGAFDPAPQWLKTWQGNGVISRSRDNRVLRALQKRSIPVVQLRYTSPQLALPRIFTDHAAVGRMAAEHLLSQGLRHFGYYGLSSRPWNQMHMKAFCATIEAAGCSCDVVPKTEASEQDNWGKEMKAIVRWLRRLPKPLGVMASHDATALKVLAACSWAGIPVPEDVAVIGVDNDAILCDLADPPLTSIAQNVEKIGYEAAALLERLMAGGRAPEQPMYIPPLGVVPRRSTELMAVDDSVVAMACRIIRQRACLGLTVDDLVAELPVSRRSLERRFEKALERGPQQEIRRVQLERVAQLLGDTDLKLSEIAEQAGFGYQEHMCRLFKHVTGRTPQEYRRGFRRIVVPS